MKRIISACLLAILLGLPALAQSTKPPLGTQIDWSDPISGLVGCWLLNEGAGSICGNLLDSSNILTLAGNTSWAPGAMGLCLNFDGTQDYATAAKLPPGLSNITYCVWFTPTLTGDSDQTILRVADTVINIDTSAPRNIVWYPDVDTTTVSAPATLAAGATYFVAVTQVGLAYCIYLNGTLIGSGDTAALDLVSATTVRVGAYNTTGTFDFSGKIHYVTIRNHALSPSEIARLYAEPFAGFQRERPELYVTSGGEPPAVGRVQVIFISGIPVWVTLALVSACVWDMKQRRRAA